MKNYRDTDYLNATARVRALENSMLGSRSLVKMVDAKNAEEAFKVLSDAAIGKGHELASYEAAFRDNMLETYSLVEKISPLPGLVDIFRYKYDGHNLKVAIKSKKLDKDCTEILSPLGNVTVAKLLEELDKKELSSFSPLLGAAGLDAAEQMAKTGDPQTVDVIIDRAVLETMAAKAAEIDNAFLSHFVQAQVDIANIRATIRLKRMKKELPMLKRVLVSGGTIPVQKLFDAYGKGYDEIFEVVSASPYGAALEPSYDGLRGETTLSLFEKLCDNYMVSIFAKVRFIAFGIEPLIAYLYGKECETNAARIVLASKLAGVPAPQITERLREAYA
ncbi:MAG: V-type ATPase subunit [Angelakisella sp.]